MPRIRSAGLVVLFACYAASLALACVGIVGGLYLPRIWVPGRLGVAGVYGFSVAILVWVVASRRSRALWRVTVPMLLAGMLAVHGLGPALRQANDDRFLRAPDLNAFAARVHEYRRIEVLTAAGENYVELNQTRVVRTRAERDSTRRAGWGSARTAESLADVLARDSIDAAVFEEFRRGLRRYHFQRLWVNGDYVLFTHYRNVGLVYATPGAPPLKRGEKVPGTPAEVTGGTGPWYHYR